MSETPDLQRVWALLDPYLQRLYREAAELPLPYPLQITVDPGDDRDGEVTVSWENGSVTYELDRYTLTWALDRWHAGDSTGFADDRSTAHGSLAEAVAANPFHPFRDA